MRRQSLFFLCMSVALSLIGFLCGCTSNNNDAATFPLKLEAASKNLKVGQTLKMDSVNANQWDAIFIFPPYTPMDKIEVALKSPLSSDITQSRIGERDDINLLIFMQGGIFRWHPLCLVTQLIFHSQFRSRLLGIERNLLGCLLMDRLPWPIVGKK